MAPNVAPQVRPFLALGQNVDCVWLCGRVRWEKRRGYWLTRRRTFMASIILTSTSTWCVCVCVCMCVCVLRPFPNQSSFDLQHF